MDKSSIKSAMLSAISEELDLWLEKENTFSDGYEYEEEFIKATRKINHILLSKSIGEVSRNRNNKKKIHTCFGRLEINKTHVLSMHTGKFGISAKLQELICLLAQDGVFEECENIFGEFLGLEISAKQIQRLSEHYGEQLENMEKNYQEAPQVSEVPPVPSIPSVPPVPPVPPVLEVSPVSPVLEVPEVREVSPVSPVPSVPEEVPTVPHEQSEPVYVMVDGSMVYTREEQWKEIKVGRIYSESSRVCVQPKRTEVTDSIYACTLGKKKDFIKKFEPYVEPYKHKIFIADGAKWIWNWVEDFYGDSVQILDFYHATEKLGTYAKLAYKNLAEKKVWLENQKRRLKEDEVENVLADLIKLAEKTTGTTDVGKALNDVIRYYQTNIERMKYGSFIKKGYLIGSGAVESAHRSVIQQRLKMSGQRWSIDGAQRIANLRSYKKSNRWKKVIEQIKMAA